MKHFRAPLVLALALLVSTLAGCGDSNYPTTPEGVGKAFALALITLDKKAYDYVGDQAVRDQIDRVWKAYSASDIEAHRKNVKVTPEELTVLNVEKVDDAVKMTVRYQTDFNLILKQLNGKWKVIKY